ncbi:hypothetical protein OLNG_00194 [Ostreococcus lucimarinus virus OlV5]|uniref:hypothetical protein n=1 Tax=Ostreococcus lucimarinus virus OlV5 TaxID=754064 RepID=UPI0002C09744|nr:hypothetical protein OLNG_00194 [Ostreococcus lucimarinus virus OlV5]AGH31265.1 hypothetical protein OLNG_00194 [Ostreococcus lucimarinus virus OlV5]
MGRTARFEQIYVANLDAEPVEEETLTGVKSILTREVEANELLLVIDPETGVKGRLGIANTTPSKSISVADKLYIDEDATHTIDLKSSGRASRWFVDNQISIGTTNPTNAFQIDSGGSTKVAIDLSGRDLMTVNGNLVASNLILSDRFTTSGSNLIIQEIESNVVTVAGGIKGSNLYAGSNVGIFDQGSNVMMLKGNVYQEGYLNLVGNIAVTGNITVSETATYIATQDLRVANVVIHSGFGNDVLSRETAFVMTPGTGYSNVALGFVAGNRGREMAFFQTDAYGGYNSASINVDNTKSVNVHVYGDIYTSNNIGAANTYPTHDLCVGSNVFIDDTNSNVVYADGNVYAKGLILGSTGLRAGNLLTLDETSDTPVTISGNVQMNALRTTGTAPSGISNLSPTDTLSVGAKIFANTTALNTLRILGNTATTNLTTEMVFSSSNLVVHADRFGGDSTSNVLVLKSGPTASNVSSIEVYGASTTATQQKITMKTKNTERIRITSDGKVGISNTGPTERLTVSGNIYVIGSNTISTGNIWGSTGNIAMRAYTSVPNGETRVENIVGAGKGLKFFASTTPTMGTPKLTLLESSNVGINVASPVGRLHTSGGTVFLNDQPTYRNEYNHLNSSLVVTNTQPIVDTTDLGTVMHLAREGNATRDGVRATFKLGKHDNTSGKSKAKLNITLSDDRYTDDTSVMTLLSSGHVGIGHTQPSAYLEVKSTGIGSATSGGLLVHNHDSGDAIIASQTPTSDGNAFTSYIQTDGATLSGWAVGVTGSGGDFRITENPDKVYDSGSIGLFIGGTTRDVGIGTDVPRGKLEVVGNVVIGQQLSFSGLSGDEFGNTHIIERRYNTDFSRTELLLFKGNDASSADNGPDRIRHIAGEHVFQTYTSSGESLYGTSEILETMDGQTDKPMVICDNGLVVVGGQRGDADGRGANTKLVVNGDLEFSGGGSFKLTGFELSTTSGATSRNIIRSKLDGSTRRPLTFVHEIDENNDDEFARFDGDGKLGMGTDSPAANVHIYDTTTESIDLMKLQSSGDNKETGLLLYTNDGEGAYARGFSNAVNGTTGLVMGVANNSTQTNCMHLIHTSNVGIGTPTPATKFHVFNGVARVESPSSNAIIELKTTAGTSNIYTDTTGNVHIQPVTASKTTFISSDVDITGNVAIGGNIDFTQIAVNLGGSPAQTDIHTAGGTIFNSNQVSRKTYAHAFSVGAGDAKDIQILFDKGAFFAKIIAMLRRTDNSTVEDLSTMILEVHGGTGDASNPSLDVSVGTKNVFGGTNSYPWSSTVTTGQRGISIVPYNIDVARIYSYDISIELMSSCGGKVTKVTRNLTIPGNLDSGTGGQTEITTFTY